MKRINLFLTFLLGIILIALSSGFTQQKTVQAPVVKSLPNGVNVGNLNIAIHDVIREGDNAFVRFVCRKIRASSENFPFAYIRLWDDHGNKYESSWLPGIFSEQFENLLQTAPLAFTWSFYIFVNVPQAAPLVKVELLGKGSFFGPGPLVKTINLAQYRLKSFELSQEITAVPLKNADYVSIGESREQNKFIEWSLGKIQVLEKKVTFDESTIEKFWLIPISARNSDYNSRSFALRFFFQLGDGTVLPASPSDTQNNLHGYFCQEGDYCYGGPYGGAFGSPSVLYIEEISPQTAMSLNFYRFPIIANNTWRIPIRIFISNVKAQTGFNVTRESLVLEINPSVFDRSNVINEIKVSIDGWKKTFSNNAANSLAFTLGLNGEKLTPESEAKYVNFRSDGSCSFRLDDMFKDWKAAGAPNLLELMTRKEKLESLLSSYRVGFKKNISDPTKQSGALRGLQRIRTLKKYLTEFESDFALKRIVDDGPKYNIAELEKIVHAYGFDRLTLADSTFLADSSQHQILDSPEKLLKTIHRNAFNREYDKLRDACIYPLEMEGENFVEVFINHIKSERELEQSTLFHVVGQQELLTHEALIIISRHVNKFEPISSEMANFVLQALEKGTWKDLSGQKVLREILLNNRENILMLLKDRGSLDGIMLIKVDNEYRLLWLSDLDDVLHTVQLDW